MYHFDQGINMKPRQYWIKRVSRIEVFESEISIVKPDPHSALWDDFAASTHVIEHRAFRELMEISEQLAKNVTDPNLIDEWKKYLRSLE